SMPLSCGNHRRLHQLGRMRLRETRALVCHRRESLASRQLFLVWGFCALVVSDPIHGSTQTVFVKNISIRLRHMH
ncbi:MAG: hypothetical protein O7C67_00230, partial [Gammaproteobacteria bacterium]|nr:hypothetical protein [Gammaproteobacteria bacterium]